jgi:diadenosine tetraphosphate (Ap4A) HIT family hydrolase
MAYGDAPTTRCASNTHARGISVGDSPVELTGDGCAGRRSSTGTEWQADVVISNSMDAADGCMLCRPEVADAFFTRMLLWQDEHWRLSAVLQGPVVGFAHLETRRHVPFITDLDGPEAATLGPVLARVTRVLRDAAEAEKTYVYVFGDACRTCTSIWHLIGTATDSGAAPVCSIPTCQTSTLASTSWWPPQQHRPSPRVRGTGDGMTPTGTPN